MDTRFILPVSVATAVHAFVLLGVKWPHHFDSVHYSSPEAIVCPPPITVDLEPPEKPDAPPENAVAAPKGNPAPLLPRLPEPIDRVSDFEQPREAPRPQPINVTAVIDAGPPGIPDGVVGGPTGVPIFFSDALDNPPRTRSQVAPAYPAAERSAGITGDVVVEFVVDEAGRVQQARIVQSSHPAFESTTLRAVQKWRFEPGKKNGQAVRFRMLAPVHFSLNS
ncbi:MAG: TonB family protein [Opitutus sp.]